MKMVSKALLFVIVIQLALLAGCGKEQQEQAELFEEGVISTVYSGGVTFEPDGKTLYLVRTDTGFIYKSHLENNVWQTPEVVSFSGKNRDMDPFVSPDGLKLFFWSNRMDDTTGEIIGQSIWVVDKTSTGWGNPKNIGRKFGLDGSQLFPSTTSDGTLYFSSDSVNGKGKLDIYRSRLVNGEYSTPENLGSAINTEFGEFDSYISPDENFMIFSSDRPGGSGKSDLYISMRKDDTWTEPRNLGPEINSAGSEIIPSISPDGKYFFYTGKTNDIQGIYYIRAKCLEIKK